MFYDDYTSKRFFNFMKISIPLLALIGFVNFVLINLATGQRETIGHRIEDRLDRAEKALDRIEVKINNIERRLDNK